MSGTVYPNETIGLLLERGTTRRYSTRAIDPKLVRLIVECGKAAPSAPGKKDPLLVASSDHATNRKLGIISRMLSTERERGLAEHVSSDQPSIIDDPSIEDAFYGAPVMVFGFSSAGWEFGREDASIAADAMMVAAHSLGISTCYVSRAKETFENGYARRWAARQGVPGNYGGAFALCLGLCGIGRSLCPDRRKIRYTAEKGHGPWS